MGFSGEQATSTGLDRKAQAEREHRQHDNRWDRRARSLSTIDGQGLLFGRIGADLASA